MHANNYTLYQLVKYHIELTEAMEYTLITYKYDPQELVKRLDFLKRDYKKGFYHKITSKLFKGSKKLTKEIRFFIKTYNKEMIEKLVHENNLHSRIEYNNNLYLAYASSNNILQVFLNEDEINKNLEKSLISLVNIANNHFLLFCIFDTLNLYISSKVNLLQGDSLYILEDIDKIEMLKLLNSLKNDINEKSLLSEAIELIKKEDNFNEENAYELLNNISIECSKTEKSLYNKFDEFTKNLEKEIEKQHK